MKQEHSCGVVPLKKEGSNIYVLLIVHKGGKHWGFPKGHKDPGESDQQTAERELREETGLVISRFLSKKPYIETYTFYKFHQKIHKKVSYFPAFVEGDLVLQLDEIIDSRWILIDQAEQHLTFKEAKEICNKVITLLQAERFI
jgi:8-oxo-dGTP pyrophosphatase MutT (NUDIX family)